MGDKSSGEGAPPPPSPLTGAYLLIVLPQTHLPQHKDNVLHNLTKGLITWDKDVCHVDLEKELQTITAQAPEGEEAKNGERLIQFASENLVTEVLIHPQLNTLVQCMRNLLSSFTRHRHIIHAGYACAGNGAWMVQDGTYSFADFADMYQELEVQRVLRAYENTVTVDIHCCQEGDWNHLRPTSRGDGFSKISMVRLNPNDKMSSVKAIHDFLNYLSPYIVSASLEELLESSDVVGNIRFSHPTLYVFPGGQGDAALFGINGFNMLVDGGFSRKACFWDFTRHLDRLDAVLMTRVNNGNIQGISSLFQRKKMEHVYPQIGHFFCNVQERRQPLSPDGDKDRDPLLINLMDLGQDMLTNLRHLQLKPHLCIRDSAMDPINLYHKVGHGKLDMYVLSPSKDSRELKDFLAKWNAVDSKIFCSYNRKGGEFSFPLCNRISICALLVWQPANPELNITRLLFPGSTPQHKIFEGLDRLKNLEFMKHAVCSAKSLSPSASTMGLSIRSSTRAKVPANIDKIPENEIRQAKQSEAVKSAVKVSSTITGLSIDKVQTKQPAPAKQPSKPKLIEKPKEKSKTDVEIKQETVKQDKIKQSEAVQKEKTKDRPKKTTQKQQTEKRIQKTPSGEKKSDSIKSSPTTPKKTSENKLIENAAKSEVKPRASTKTKPSPSATPAKSAKEANNRKVLEQKSRETSKMQKVSTAKKEEKKIEKVSVPKRTPAALASPTKTATTKPTSPIKTSRTVRQKQQDVKKVMKVEKDLPTDSSAVSTPSTVDADLAGIKVKEDVVEKECLPATDSKSDEAKDLAEEKPTTLSKEEEDEILIIEKIEIDGVEEAGKRDVESIAMHIQKSDKKVEEIAGKLAGEHEVAEEKEKSKSPELEKAEEMKEDADAKLELETLTKGKFEMQKTESQETSAAVPSLEKLITPKDSKDGQKEVTEQKPADESQPDEKFSTTVESGATTTAPTLPEDERIPLDEIKEQIEEKYIKEETKEKDVPGVPHRPEQPTSLPEVPKIASSLFDQRAQLLKDIVKTPDEVADLPVHEEADAGIYVGGDSAASKELQKSREDLLTIPPTAAAGVKKAAPADKKEAEVAEELKFIKDGLEKEDKSKDLREDLLSSDQISATIPTDISSGEKPDTKEESDEKIQEDKLEGKVSEEKADIKEKTDKVGVLQVQEEKPIDEGIEEAEEIQKDEDGIVEDLAEVEEDKKEATVVQPQDLTEKDLGIIIDDTDLEIGKIVSYTFDQLSKGDQFDLKSKAVLDEEEDFTGEDAELKMIAESVAQREENLSVDQRITTIKRDSKGEALILDIDEDKEVEEIEEKIVSDTMEKEKPLIAAVTATVKEKINDKIDLLEEKDIDETEEKALPKPVEKAGEFKKDESTYAVTHQKFEDQKEQVDKEDTVPGVLAKIEEVTEDKIEKKIDVHAEIENKEDKRVEGKFEDNIDETESKEVEEKLDDKMEQIVAKIEDQKKDKIDKETDVPVAVESERVEKTIKKLDDKIDEKDIEKKLDIHEKMQAGDGLIDKNVFKTEEVDIDKSEITEKILDEKQVAEKISEIADVKEMRAESPLKFGEDKTEPKEKPVVDQESVSKSPSKDEVLEEKLNSLISIEKIGEKLEDKTVEISTVETKEVGSLLKEVDSDVKTDTLAGLKKDDVTVGKKLDEIQLEEERTKIESPLGFDDKLGGKVKDIVCEIPGKMVPDFDTDIDDKFTSESKHLGKTLESDEPLKKEKLSKDSPKPSDDKIKDVVDSVIEKIEEKIEGLEDTKPIGIKDDLSQIEASKIEEESVHVKRLSDETGLSGSKLEKQGDLDEVLASDGSEVVKKLDSESTIDQDLRIADKVEGIKLKEQEDVQELSPKKEGTCEKETIEVPIERKVEEVSLQKPEKPDSSKTAAMDLNVGTEVLKSVDEIKIKEEKAISEHLYHPDKIISMGKDEVTEKVEELSTNVIKSVDKVEDKFFDEPLSQNMTADYNKSDESEKSVPLVIKEEKSDKVSEITDNQQLQISEKKLAAEIEAYEVELSIKKFTIGEIVPSISPDSDLKLEEITSANDLLKSGIDGKLDSVEGVQNGIQLLHEEKKIDLIESSSDKDSIIGVAKTEEVEKVEETELGLVVSGSLSSVEKKGETSKVEAEKKDEISTVEEKKPETSKILQEKKDETTKVEEKKDETTKVEEKKDETTKVEEKKDETTKVEEKKDETTKVEEKKDETTKVEEKKDETLEFEVEKMDEILKIEEKKDEKSTSEVEKVDTTKVEEKKDETTKVEEKKDETTKVEEKKDETSKFEVEKMDKTTKDEEKMDKTTKDEEKMDKTTKDEEKKDVTSKFEEEKKDETSKVEEKKNETSEVEEKKDGKSKIEEKKDETSEVEEKKDETSKVEGEKEIDKKTVIDAFEAKSEKNSKDLEIYSKIDSVVLDSKETSLSKEEKVLTERTFFIEENVSKDELKSKDATSNLRDAGVSRIDFTVKDEESEETGEVLKSKDCGSLESFDKIDLGKQPPVHKEEAREKSELEVSEKSFIKEDSDGKTESFLSDILKANAAHVEDKSRVEVSSKSEEKFKFGDSSKVEDTKTATTIDLDDCKSKDSTEKVDEVREEKDLKEMSKTTDATVESGKILVQDTGDSKIKSNQLETGKTEEDKVTVPEGNAKSGSFFGSFLEKTKEVVSSLVDRTESVISKSDILETKQISEQITVDEKVDKVEDKTKDLSGIDSKQEKVISESGDFTEPLLTAIDNEKIGQSFGDGAIKTGLEEPVSSELKTREFASDSLEIKKEATSDKAVKESEQVKESIPKTSDSPPVNGTSKIGVKLEDSFNFGKESDNDKFELPERITLDKGVLEVRATDIKTYLDKEIREEELHSEKDEVKVTDILSTAEKIVLSLNGTSKVDDREQVIKDIEASVSTSKDAVASETITPSLEPKDTAELSEKGKFTDSDTAEVTSQSFETFAKGSMVHSSFQNGAEKLISLVDSTKETMANTLPQTVGAIDSVMDKVEETVEKKLIEVDDKLAPGEKDKIILDSKSENGEVGKVSSHDSSKTSDISSNSQAKKDESKAAETEKKLAKDDQLKEITSSFLQSEVEKWDDGDVKESTAKTTKTDIIEQGTELVEDIIDKGAELAQERKDSLLQEAKVSETTSKDIEKSSVKDKQQELLKPEGDAFRDVSPLNLLKKDISRSGTPGSDPVSERDYDVGRATPLSDVSSGQVSHAVIHGWETSEGRPESRHYDSDEDVPGSPLSVTSHVPSPPQFEYDLKGKDSMMTSSFYGSFPSDLVEGKPTAGFADPEAMFASMYVPKYGDSDDQDIGDSDSLTKEEKSGPYDSGFSGDKELDTDFETAVKEHTAIRGTPLYSSTLSSGHPEPKSTSKPSTSLKQTTITGSKLDSSLISGLYPTDPETSPKPSTSLEQTTVNGSKLDSGLTFGPYPTEQKTSPKPSTSQTEPAKTVELIKDPIEKWDKPLGLPPPPPPQCSNRPYNFWNPFKEWGTPLSLPAPAPPPPREDSHTDIEVDTSGSAKTTPKKISKMNAENNKLALNNSVGKEANNKTKRSDSPVKKLQNKENRKSSVNPIYMDLSYVPHHGNSHYANVEFFKKVRARYYVFSGTEPSKEVFNALLEAKQTWEDKDLEVTIIPTYDTDTLGYWIAENEETLSKYKIDLSPSASRCTINLQDHDTSCSAYRLEF